LKFFLFSNNKIKAYLWSYGPTAVGKKYKVYILPFRHLYSGEMSRDRGNAKQCSR
jgi:hypothetical protein